MSQHPRFGNLVGRHAGRFGAGGWLWYVGAILTAAGLMNIGQGAGLVPGDAGLGDPGTTILIGVIALVLGAAVFFTAVMRWQQSVTVYERGFVYAKLLGTVEVAFADVTNVEHVRTHSRSGTSESLTVKRRSGAEVTIGSVSDIEQLTSMIRNAPR